MKLTFVGNVMQIDEARMVFKHFSDKLEPGERFRTPGDRDFCVVLPNDEYVEELMNRGVNVTIKPPKEEGDSPFIFFKVKVKYTNFPPKVYVQSGKKRYMLDEDDVHVLDKMDIQSVDMDLSISSTAWEMNGRTGNAVYLRSLKVIQALDRFAEEEYPQDDDEMPFA